MQLHPALDLFYHRPVQKGVCMLDYGQQCTGCYCWVQCKNKGQLMPSPTMARSLLGYFSRGTYPPAVGQRVLPLPIRSSTSSSLQAISSAGDREVGARFGAGRFKSLKDSGGAGSERGDRGDIDGEGS